VSKFKDRLGREWVLDMTVADLKPLSQVGIMFKGFEVQHDSIPAALFSDPAKLMEVLMVLAHVGDEVAPEDFARGFDTAATERAIGATLEALSDFSPTCPQGAAKSRLLRQAWERGLSEMSSRLSKSDVGNWPESPASTPNAAP
jgi:hypothetical protein